MSIPFNQNLEKEKEIINEISYICEGDESAATVDKENIINGYSYGTNTIPVNNIIAPSMKIYEEKNFQLLGFVNKSSIPRESFMGEVELVVPTNLGKLSDHEMVIAKKEFTALVNSMKSLEKYAIARYVPRNSKNGVNPRLVTLIPHIT
jgi:ATP-dependent DNA helicase 2 subunit 2